MLGIIFGTLCLIALIATVRRERYFRRHGYPQYPRGYHGCGHHHHGDPPQERPASDPTAGAAPTQGSAS